MMEHAYVDENYVLATEFYLYKNPTKLVWTGDYANSDDKYRGNLNCEEKYEKNLYKMCDEYPELKMKMAVSPELTSTTFKYLINHTKKEYIDKEKMIEFEKSRGTNYIIHPLPLLTCETDGGGGGDYSGDCEEWVGAWARHFISVDNAAPGEDYKEVIVPFREC